MIKKTITYTDYLGTERTEDFHFNLTKAEILEMELTTVGGMETLIERITKAKDIPTLVDIFTKIVHKAYGVISDDGRKFIKNKQVLEDFIQTEAYSELFTELITDADAAAAFCNGIIPPEAQQKANPIPPIR